MTRGRKIGIGLVVGGFVAGVLSQSFEPTFLCLLGGMMVFPNLLLNKIAAGRK